MKPYLLGLNIFQSGKQEHCDEIAGCFSDPTSAVMRKALFFAKQILRSEGAGVTKQRHCFVTQVGDACETPWRKWK